MSRRSGGKKNDTTAKATRNKRAPSMGVHSKPSGRPEDKQRPDLISDAVLKKIVDSHATAVAGMYWDAEDAKFRIGREARLAHDELIGTGKRLPDGMRVEKPMAAALRRLGVREISPGSIYDYMRADETREALGGKGKAPKLSISYYVEVSKDDITMEKREEHLLTALHNHLSVHRLREFIKDKDAAKVATPVATTIEGLERALSEVQSVVSEQRIAISGVGVEPLPHSVARIENLAIFLWQFSEDLTKGGEGVAS